MIKLVGLKNNTFTYNGDTHLVNILLMIKQKDIKCTAQHIENLEYIKENLAKNLDVSSEEINQVRVVKRSIDARGGNVQYNLKLEYTMGEDKLEEHKKEFVPQNVQNASAVHIVGMGPSGLFAALRLIERGLKPIIFERGKPVEERKKDIAQLHREAIVDENSNYAFGEGGAGTYSDGKLFTRSKKRGDRDFVLQVLNQFGANPDILVETHAHIGTDKLPDIIKNIRQIILEAGGEIHFSTKIVDFLVEADCIKSLVCDDGTVVPVEHLILATGHSASEIYEWLADNKYPIEAKSFAMGVRVEHPQALINEIRYRRSKENIYLPPAEYRVAVQTKERGVYSFCMCPGGIIVPAMTENKTIVLNGMSNSIRNSKWANAGLVTEVRPKDIFDHNGDDSPLAGLKFQKELERLSFQNAGNGIAAPAQRLNDFFKKKISRNLPESSYSPGLVISPLHFWIPDFMSTALREGLKKIDSPMRGFLTNEAIMCGVESRTSSPVRIPRDRETLEYVGIKRVFPAGEGAGYAGGIVSSAIDGLNVADAVANSL